MPTTSPAGPARRPNAGPTTSWTCAGAAWPSTPPTTGPAAAVQVVVDADLLDLIDDQAADPAAADAADSEAGGTEPAEPPRRSNDGAGRARTTDRPAEPAEPVGRRPRDPLTARCELLAPDPIPIGIETARRLLCDSFVSRAVLRGRSEVLDLGRASRLFSTPQRRAIILRDGGCIAQGCDRGAQWCEIHHLRPWEHGGSHRSRQRRPHLRPPPPPRPRRRLAHPHPTRRPPPPHPRPPRHPPTPRRLIRSGSSGRACAPRPGPGAGAPRGRPAARPAGARARAGATRPA